MNRISGVIGFAVLLAVLAVPCLAANNVDVPRNTRWIWYPEGDPARPDAGVGVGVVVVYFTPPRVPV